MIRQFKCYSVTVNIACLFAIHFMRPFYETLTFLTELWDTGDMFSFDALCGFPAVITFQMAGHCVLSIIVNLNSKGKNYIFVHLL